MNNKNFFLISFLPAIAYWYLEANYSLKIALAGGCILALIEVSLEWIFTKHIHSLSKLNFFLIVILGGIAFLAQEGIWFKLQPFFTGIALFIAIQWKLRSGTGFLTEMWQSMGRADRHFPLEVLMIMEKQLSFLFFFYGIFMAFVAFTLSTSQWVFFKTAGFYIAFFIFALGQMIWLRKKMKKF